MQSSGKWKRTLAAGLVGSALLAGAAFASDGRMTAQKSTSSRRSASAPRVVEFKTERTDSWLCEYVNPFFCSSIPNVVATPQPGTATTNRRGRR
jgi:hypothetical protein